MARKMVKIWRMYPLLTLVSAHGLQGLCYHCDYEAPLNVSARADRGGRSLARRSFPKARTTSLRVPRESRRYRYHGAAPELGPLPREPKGARAAPDSVSDPGRIYRGEPAR